MFPINNLLQLGVISVALRLFGAQERVNCQVLDLMHLVTSLSCQCSLILQLFDETSANRDLFILWLILLTFLVLRSRTKVRTERLRASEEAANLFSLTRSDLTEELEAAFGVVLPARASQV